MKTHLKTLLILIIGLLGFSLFVMGLHWIVTINPYYGISVLLGGALIIIYMIIYQGLKSRE
jgi:predicted tellurium resistance membrane protein TerC